MDLNSPIFDHAANDKVSLIPDHAVSDKISPIPDHIASEVVSPIPDHAASDKISPIPDHAVSDKASSIPDHAASDKVSESIPNDTNNEHPSILVEKNSVEYHSKNSKRKNSNEDTNSNSSHSRSFKKECVSVTNNFVSDSLPKSKKQKSNDSSVSSLNDKNTEALNMVLGETKLRRSQRHKFPPLEGWRGQRLIIKDENGDISGVEVDEGRQPVDFSFCGDIKTNQKKKKYKKKTLKKVGLLANSDNSKHLKGDLIKSVTLDPLTSEEKLVRYQYKEEDISSVEVHSPVKRIIKKKKDKKKTPKRVRFLAKSTNSKHLKKDLKKKEVLDPLTGERELVYLHRPHNTLLWTLPQFQDRSNAPYLTAKSFTGPLLSFGYIEVGVGKIKNKQHSPGYNIHFNVVKGNNIEICIHETSLHLKELDSVVVPAGNTYSIHNNGKSAALLHFTLFKTALFDVSISLHQ